MESRRAGTVRLFDVVAGLRGARWRHNRLLTHLLLVMALLPLLAISPGAAPARAAATLTVTTNADSGAGSLRAQIAAADNGDTIEFAPSLVGQTITLTSGELVVTRNITIQNSNLGTITLDGNNNSRVLRIASSLQVTIRHLTIQHGRAVLGGGILVDVSAIVTLDRLVITANRAQGPNGDDSSDVNTATTGGKPGLGGGIWNGGAINLRNSTVSSNVAQGGNGGNGLPISVGGNPQQGGAGGGGGLGGGLYSQGLVLMERSTLSANDARGGAGGNGTIGGGGGGGIGGAIFQDGNLSLTDVTLVSNTTHGGDGGTGNPAGLASLAGTAGGFGEGGSTAGGSAPSSGAGGLGGGGAAGGAGTGGNGGPGGGGGGGLTTAGTGSTGGGNGRGSGAGGGGGLGSALFVNTITTIVRNNTIALNGGTGGTGSDDLANGAVAASGQGRGGGIFVLGAPPSLGATIVAGNTAVSGVTSQPDDINGAVAGNAYNLVQNTTGSTGLGGTDVLNQDPLLGPPLVNEPGETATMALLTNSPARDAGPPSGCLDAGGAPLQLDQRGVQRAVRSGNNSTAICDIGAYEADATVLVVAPTLVTFVENNPPLPIDPALTLTDPNTDTFTGAVVVISANYHTGEDLLVFTNQAPITGNFDAGTGTLTLTGTASLAQYQAAMRTVAYQTASDTPSTDIRTITFQVTNATLGESSNQASRPLTVQPVNDPPVNTLPASSPSTPEDTALVLTVASSTAIQVADVDALGNPVRVALTITNGTLTLSGTAGLTFSVGDGTDDAAMTFSGTVASVNTALDGLRYTPTLNFNGSAALQIATTDNIGQQDSLTDTDTLTITVTPVNDAPTAVDDFYGTVADAPITIAAPGVLGNDTDIDSTTIQAQIETQPAHGSVSLNPDGGFTYTPVPGFVGNDSFTYRASDGTASSSPAIARIAIVQTACAPRPKVTNQLAAGGNALQVTIQSTPLNTPGANPLVRLDFGTFQNARVTLNGQPITSGQSYLVPSGATSVTFTVTRVTPGQPTTLPLTVTDGCGQWKTFVGGGTAAGF